MDFSPAPVHLRPMQRASNRLLISFPPASLLVLSVLLFPASLAFADRPTSAALTTYQNYVAAVEARLARQHSSASTFLAGSALDDQAGLRHSDLIVEGLTPAYGVPLSGALLHHWRATAFIPGTTAADFGRLLRDFSDYPRVFGPQVLSSRVLAQNSNHLEVTMRVRQRHVLAVVMDTTYDVTFGQLDPRHRFSISRSTEISEIADPGTPSERALTPSEDHGYLWRQNTYWSWEERDGGLYLQIESVSLTRSIPYGLAWAVGPYTASVPRESLTFTLRSAAAALRGAQKGTRP